MTVVRRLVGADAAIWRALRLEALKTYPQAFLTTYDEAAALPRDTIAARLDAGATFGVFVADRAVGIASLLPQDRAQTRHRAEIGAFYVQPTVQGQGAADRLMSAVIEAGQRMGIWQLELFVAASNTRAIRFYARHGFDEAGRIPNATLAEGVSETDLILIRSDPPGA